MSTELITRLKDLKLYGMAQCWPELSAKVRHGEFDAERLMAELCSAEAAERDLQIDRGRGGRRWRGDSQRAVSG